MRGTHLMLGSIMVLAAGFLAAAASTQHETVRPRLDKLDPSRQQTPAPRGSSLFERLGGTYAIAAVVDDYLNGLAHDPVIMANPQVKAACESAHASNSIPGLKFQITAWLIDATGGPYEFHGKPMKASHTALKITEREWAANTAVFKASLDKFNVPAKEQEELLAIVQATHDDIVIAGAGVPDSPTAR